MGIQQILTGLGKAADPGKVLTTNRKKSDEEAKKVDETQAKDKIDLSEDGLRFDLMTRELERIKAGIKEDPQNAIKAQANISRFSALEIMDESYGSVFAQLDEVKEQISDNAKLAADTQSNIARNSAIRTISE